MSFGKQTGPPASRRQLDQLLELLQEAGHTDFRDARGPMGFTQRQAAGKFTRDEADELITNLEEAANDEAAPGTGEDAGAVEAAPPSLLVKRTATSRALERYRDQDLAAELQRRGWVVLQP